MHEESVEPTAGGGGRHGPDDDLDGEGHDFGDLVAKHDGEESSEAPNGGLDLLALRRVAVEALVVPQEAEEGDEVDVGGDDEDD